MAETLYDLLRVGPVAPLSELRASYKRRMLEVHPDKGGNVELCQRVVAAFELLADPTARQLYDARLAKYDPPRRQSKSKRGLSPRVTRAAEGSGLSSHSNVEQPHDVKCDTKGARRDDEHVDGAAGPHAKRPRESAPDGLFQASASATTGFDAFSAHGDNSFKAGCPGNKCPAPTRKISRFVNRAVSLLRRLPRDARRDFIGRRLSEPQRQAIETFMLSEARNAATSGAAKGDRTEQESGTHASSASSDESLDSDDGRSEDHEEQALALCNQEHGCGELLTSHSVPIQWYGRIKDEHASTRMDVGEEEQTDEGEREPHFAHDRLVWNCLTTADEAVQDNEVLEKKEEKVEIDEIDTDVKQGEDEKEQNEEMEGDKSDKGEEDMCEAEDLVAGRGKRRVAAAARIRGISHVRLKGRDFYCAKIGFDWLGLRAPRRCSLERALDDHILLVAIRARVRASSRDSEGELRTPPRTFEDELRSAIPEVLEENGVKSSRFRLDIHISLPAYHWIGRYLTSPFYTLGSLDTALKVWRRFREARGQLGVGGAGLLFRCSPGEAMLIWERVREVYLAAWAERGANVRLVSENLDAWEAANTQRRRRKVEHWERTRMEREERLQRSILRSVIVANAKARRWERRERVAMRREDMRLRFVRRSYPVIDRLGRLVSLWAQELEKIQRQGAILRARDLQRSAAACRRMEQARLRALHIQRERRWRWLRRKDLTMEEILRGWPAEQ